MTIFILDILACHAVTASSHEYADYVDSDSINFQINYVTLLTDSVVLFSQMLCILYILYYNIKIFLGFQNKAHHPYVLKFIVLLIGRKNFKNFKQISDDAIIAAIFPFMLFTPIISFSSHCIYILLAWLTEPEKASVIFLTLYSIFIVLFYAFKSLYNHFSSFKVIQRKRKVDANFVSDEPDENATQHESIPGHDPECNDEDMPHEHINTQAFCLTLLFSSLIVLFVLMMLGMFVIIPFESVSLINYVVNVFQIFILILSSQFAIKVIFNTSFDFYSFIEVFKHALGKKEKLKNENVKAVVHKKEELYKVAGVITAEVTSTILDLANSPEQTTE